MNKEELFNDKKTEPTEFLNKQLTNRDLLNETYSELNL